MNIDLIYVHIYLFEPYILRYSRHGVFPVSTGSEKLPLRLSTWIIFLHTHPAFVHIKETKFWSKYRINLPILNAIAVI